MDEYTSLQNELDLYLNFFKRRAELALDYGESLRKLAYKQQELDRRFDEDERMLADPTWKKAYIDIRSNLLEESKAQAHFAEKTRGLVSSLSAFKDRKDRMRRRIKDDVKSTTTEHADYKTAVLRLRKTYEHKVDEVKSHEEGDSHETFPPEHWTGSDASGGAGGGRDRRHSGASSRGGVTDRDSPPLSSPPISSSATSSTSPAPVFVSGATSTAPTAPSPYRDVPSAKSQNVFEHITKRDWTGEKHRVNSIVRAVGNLAKGVDGTSGIKPSAVRGAKSRLTAGKLKREAEQADRDYRDSIFRLDTLRLQRDRINRSAVSSLKEFASELSDMLRGAFHQHLIDLELLSCNEIALARNTLSEVEKIDAELDAANVTARLRENDMSEPPVYYHNAFVGECRTLLFGVSLTDYLSTHPNQYVPLIVKTCIAQIELTGIYTEGIYRIPGKLATVQQLVHQVEKDEVAFSFESRVDPAAVAGVLKLYLRQLPTPLFPFSTSDRLAFSADFHLDPETQLSSLMRRIRRLSAPHQATLKALCTHLAKIASYEKENKMTSTNLGLVFSPVVFGEDEGTTLESAKHSSKDNVMELLIVYHLTLFSGLPIEPPTVARSRHGSVSETHYPVAPPSQVHHQHSHSHGQASITPIPRPRRNSSSSPPTDVIPKPLRQSSDPSNPSNSVEHLLPFNPPTPNANDSVYNLYHQASSAPLLDTPGVSHPFSYPESLDSPTPPLSAAGGRRIPTNNSTPDTTPPRRPTNEGVRSSSLPDGWDGPVSSAPLRS